MNILLKSTLVVLYGITLWADTPTPVTSEPSQVKQFTELVRGGKHPKEVLKKELTSHRLVILKCSMQGCVPCKAVEPEFRKLAQRYKERAHFINLDVIRFEEIAHEFNIKSVPTFIIFNREKQIAVLQGPKSIAKLATILNQQKNSA